MQLSTLIFVGAIAASMIGAQGPEHLMHSVLRPIKLSSHAKGPSVSKTRSNQARITDVLSTGVGEIECDPVSGLAIGAFPCKDINLSAFMTGVDLGSPYASNPSPLIYATWVSDIWGWTDPFNGREYALVGMWDGTSIVDITDPVNPETVAFVETTMGVTDGLEGINNIWRDIKVVGDVMYVGAEVSFHGIQAFDLTSLRESVVFEASQGVFGFFFDLWSMFLGFLSMFLPFLNFSSGPTDTGIPIVSPTFVTSELGSTHNLVAAPGKIIGVGMRDVDATCPMLGGFFASLAVFDVSSTPLEPQFEDCIYIPIGAGYVHDAHCVEYNGPDADYTGETICALFMESAIAIYNLDTKTLINSFSYTTFAYVHQGWFSEDHATIYADDELDELFFTTGTDFSTCYIFDVSDLDATIQPPTTFVTPSDHPSIDHNLYVKDGYIYQAAYTSGARIRKINADTSLEETAYFDVDLDCECVADVSCTCDSFDGTWTYFPYFDSGMTIAGGTSVGLFILRPTGLV